MEELAINYNYLIEAKEELSTNEKDLKKLLKKIERIEEKLAENEEDVKAKNNLKKLSKEKIELKKIIKEQKNKYNELLKKASEVYFNDITLADAKRILNSIYGVLSTRGERRISKFTYYYSDKFYDDYRQSIIYYLVCTYAVNRMIATNKYLNRFLKFPIETIQRADVSADLYEYYFSNNGCTKILNYIKRFVL